MKAKYKKLKKKDFHKKEKPKKEKEKDKVFNYGLAILKSLMAFLVLISHHFNKRSTRNKYILNFTENRRLHVPTFFILSFNFMYKHLILLNPKIIFNRLLRLLIPYVGWTYIIWKINHVMNVKYNKKFLDKYTDLIFQLKWGWGYLCHFWFQWNIIVITILFIIIIFIFRKHHLFVLQILLLLCYVSQYSGYYLYNPIINRFHLNIITFKFLFESIPYTVTGFTLGYYKIIDILQNHKIKTLTLSLIVYNVIADYKIFINKNGINFFGVDKNIKTLCIIFIFSLFPSDKIKNKYLSKFLIIITNYSAGVYYLHTPIFQYLQISVDEFKKGSLLAIFIDYLICYFICFVGMLIFGRTPLKYLFS